MKVLLEGSFLDRKENLLIFGNPGAGKSHLLCAIALELVATQARKVKYTTVAMLVRTCCWRSGLATQQGDQTAGQV